MTYANGSTVKLSYNGLGQPVSEKWYFSEADAAADASPIAHYKYVYDGSGNIVRSLDMLALKEYNYEYESGVIVRATESAITLSGEIVTSKGLWGTLATQAAPYILSLFCWINTIPIVGQIIFGLVAYATVKFASYAVTAYYLKKKGLDLSIKWRRFLPYLKVTYK